MAGIANGCSSLCIPKHGIYSHIVYSWWMVLICFDPVPYDLTCASPRCLPWWFTRLPGGCQLNVRPGQVYCFQVIQAGCLVDLAGLDSPNREISRKNICATKNIRILLVSVWVLEHAKTRQLPAGCSKPFGINHTHRPLGWFIVIAQVTKWLTSRCLLKGGANHSSLLNTNVWADLCSVHLQFLRHLMAPGVTRASQDGGILGHRWRR